MKTIKGSVLIAFAFALALFGLAGDAAAQTRRATRENQVRDLVRKIQVQNDNFRSTFEAATQNVRLRGTEADNINRYMDDLNSSVSDFEDRFNNRQATAPDVQSILDAAANINRFLQQTRLGTGVDREWASLRTMIGQLAREYNLSANWSGGYNSTYPGDNRNYPNDNRNYPSNNRNYPSGNSGYGSRLNGTYRVDYSRSDNPRDVAERAVNSLPANSREDARQRLEQRLETPDRLAIEQRGRQITIASSRAARYTFEADGRDKFETTDNGSQLRVRATLAGDRLEVSTAGDRGNDYNVTFEPIDNGRSLRVTRRLSTDILRQPVLVTSVYEKSSEVAQLDIYDNPNGNTGNYPTTTGGRTGNHIIRNGETIRAILNETLTTKDSQGNDRFTMTVETPTQYRGAVIEGYVAGANRSGKVTGRAQMNFNFERIRMLDGRTYEFAGFVESIRTANGDTVKVDNEGAVKGENQTNKTATRGAIGAGIGAVIGAIAGGGKGAAIGAILGGGAGAGSVYIEGRDDLEIASGSEVYIRASAPAGNYNR